VEIQMTPATPPAGRFRPDAALARRLGSYSLLAGAALAQAGPAAANSITATPDDLPYTFPAPPSGDVKGVTHELALDVDADGKTDFTFTTFYASEFEPEVGSSWTTIKDYLTQTSPNLIYGHTSRQPLVSHRITSRACNSAMISATPSGPGIEGHSRYTHHTNYLTFYRKVRTACVACTNVNYRTLLYDDGKWSDSPGGGAVPFQLSSGSSAQYGWIHVDIPGRTTQATIESVEMGPGTVTGIEDNASCLADHSLLEPDPATTTTPDRMLALPLPDGSVPMTLGLLATGAAGNQLWRAAQTRLAELPAAR
jgi:hypothetical protein